MPGLPSEVLTVQEVADYLKVTAKTVYGLVKAGELRTFRIGRAVRCRKVDVEQFIAERERAHTEGAVHRGPGVGA